MTLGKRIRYYRQLREFSQETLGEKIGADARTISNYETGKYKPSADTIVALAKAFEISTDKLLLGAPYNNTINELLDQRELLDLFLEVSYLPETDREVIKNLVDYLVGKNKFNQ